MSFESTVEPVEITIPHGGEAFWLDERTVGHVVTNKERRTACILANSVVFTDEGLNVTSDLPALLGKFTAASPSSFRYAAKIV